MTIVSAIAGFPTTVDAFSATDVSNVPNWVPAIVSVPAAVGFPAASVVGFLLAYLLLLMLLCSCHPCRIT
jgi:hypothetical protein